MLFYSQPIALGVPMMIPAWFAAICAPGTHGVALTGGLLAGMFLAAAGGSVTHCGPMCGPFVLAQVADRMAAIPGRRLTEARRLRASLLLPYHAGRLITYAALGAAAGGIARGVAAAPFLPAPFLPAPFLVAPFLAAMRPVLLLVAAGLFLGFALRRVAPGIAAVLPQHPPKLLAQGILRFTRGLNRASLGGRFGLGLALGFLPCGLVYAALAAAAATGSPALGALAMAVFGLGTVPMLALLGIAGQTRPVARVLARLAPLALLLNAAVLVALVLV